jgi:hypothetical protein
MSELEIATDVMPSQCVFGSSDPIEALSEASRVVQYMVQHCKGAEYIASIQGRNYPKVEWWTTAGMGLSLFPREEKNTRIVRDDPNEIIYEAVVAVYRGDQLITRASAIVSSNEKSWRNRDEYAIKSMATTRATGKAYRIGLSGLAVMAGLEATPAEEVPKEGFRQKLGNENPTPPAANGATKKQIGMITGLSRADEISDVIRERVEVLLATGLDKAKASEMIESLQAQIELQQEAENA